MACDRFIYWPEDQAPPTRAQINQALQQYLGEAGEFEEREDRVLVTLPGAPSAMWEGLTDHHRPAFHDERWFEVWFAEDGRCIDVITRRADAFTSAVAEGFVRAVILFWGGVRDD